MADSYWTGTTPGGVAVFAVPFPYLEQSDVTVQLNGVTLRTPRDYVWNPDGSIQISPTPSEGQTLTIARNTSPDRADVSFTNGAMLSASDLNTAALQCFYRTQEIQDQLNSYINAGMARYQIADAELLTSPSDLIAAAADAALQTSIAQQLLSTANDVQTNANNVLANTNQASLLQAAVDNLTSLVPAGIGAYLTNETNARIAGDAALQSAFNLMGAVSNQGLTFVLNTANVYVDSVTSMAEKFSGIESEIAGNTAAITTEATTRASADSAQSTLITGLTASLASTNGTISTNAAAIATEATARASGDTTVASSITSLTTTVNGNTASISAQATSLNGLGAQYVLKVNNNGHVSGFGLASGAGGVSNFAVVANTFSLIDPGNGAAPPVVPFTITGSVCYLQSVVFDTALIADASIPGAAFENAAIGTAQIATAAITSAQIANAAITSATIANLAVTNAHFADPVRGYRQDR